MKKLHLFIGIALISVVGLLGIGRIAAAYDIRAGDNVTISQDKKIYDSIYTAGRTVDITGEVFGDVFCAGQNVSVSGTVHGDVMCAGQTLNVSGKVDGDVRLTGQTVTLGAEVTRNATIAGQSFVLESTGSVAGDLTTGSQDATLNGRIGRDIVIGSGNVTINNLVGRNVKAQAETMKLMAGARVGGNIEITSDRDVSKDKQAVVSGKITRTAPEHGQSKSKHGAVWGFGIIWFLYWLLALLITAIVLTLLFPRLFHAVTDNATPRPWKALLVGFIASIVVPFSIVALAASVVGLPLALILGLVWLAALLLSGPLFGYYIGRLMLRDSRKPLLIMLAGATALIILYFIPILGFLAILATIWIGAGMLLLEIFQKTPKPSYNLTPATSKTKK